jgi:hypothetical protein
LQERGRKKCVCVHVGSKRKGERKIDDALTFYTTASSLTPLLEVFPGGTPMKSCHRDELLFRSFICPFCIFAERSNQFIHSFIHSFFQSFVRFRATRRSWRWTRTRVDRRPLRPSRRPTPPRPRTAFARPSSGRRRGWRASGPCRRATWMRTGRTMAWASASCHHPSTTNRPRSLCESVSHSVSQSGRQARKQSVSQSGMESTKSHRVAESSGLNSLALAHATRLSTSDKMNKRTNKWMNESMNA